MGGCRCIFRDCTVSTVTNRDMHFFHFPIKDPVRFQNWVKMAGAEAILNLPPSQQKNRVVCARHFHEEQFMNYKMNRLVGTAVPTLMRLRRYLVLDYADLDDDNMPKLKSLKPTEVPHLVSPPDFKCPLHLEDDDKYFTIFNNGSSQSNGLEDTITMTFDCEEPQHENFDIELLDNSSQDVDNNDTNRKRKPQDNHLEVIKKRRILNEEIGKSPICVETMRYDKTVDTIDENFKYLTTFVQPKKVYNNISQKLEHNKSHLTNCPQPRKAHKIAGQEIEHTHARLIDISEENDQLKRSNLKTSESFEELMSTYSKLKLKYKHLKEQYNFCENEYQKLEELNVKLQQKNLHLQIEKEQQEEELEAEGLSNLKTTGAEDAQLAVMSNKMHIFNSIKKYLPGSMVALVRMEMFGRPERPWKADERQAAVDLFGLGNDVYRYLSEEWQIRLPPLSEVNEWFKENVMVKGENE